MAPDIFIELYLDTNLSAHSVQKLNQQQYPLSSQYSAISCLILYRTYYTAIALQMSKYHHLLVSSVRWSLFFAVFPYT